MNLLLLFGCILLVLPFLDFFPINFVMMKNLVDFLDDVNLRTLLVELLDDDGGFRIEIGTEF